MRKAEMEYDKQANSFCGLVLSREKQSWSPWRSSTPSTPKFLPCPYLQTYGVMAGGNLQLQSYAQIVLEIAIESLRGETSLLDICILVPRITNPLLTPSQFSDSCVPSCSVLVKLQL